METLETLIHAIANEVATGKERKYFWQNPNVVVSNVRNKMVSTIVALHAAKKGDTKIESSAGTYEVKDYKIPNVDWVKTLVNFGHRVYTTNVSEIDEIYLPISCRAHFEEDVTVPEVRTNDPDFYKSVYNNAKEATILSPEAFEKALQQVSQYNKDWATTTEITKTPVSINAIHGMYDTEGKYYVMNRTQNRLQSMGLGLTCTSANVFGIRLEPLTFAALVEQLGAEKTSGNIEVAEQV